MRGKSVMLADLLAVILCGSALAQVERGSQGHVSLILHNNWQSRPDEVQMHTLFRQGEAAKGGAYFHLYTESHPIYLARIRDGGWPRAVPAVIQQDPDGRAVELVYGAKIPHLVPQATLAECPAVGASASELPWGNLPPPETHVAPDESPVIDTNVVVQPSPPEPEADNSVLIAVAIVLAICGVVAGVSVPLIHHFKGA